ncbi:hypothetical protein CO045_00130 [Candidatus Peregrinibacteria bacterium CG_4_9_14_0_2_um_filter_41_14]|nr:MAG: hypothetical protein COY06_03375 [Candidatus Peregrinibacteria bacterium CG_4_10_14_0_2_um_filter_41_8]PJC38452.1 MAG: hypothetical protein CO045_00130 [Candidatus Peregrinibacteria bacterium CG_4_9_14_0_2_um_filter_41_14]
MNYYKELFTVLSASNIKYLIVGGVAVNLYGYTRFTGDIDILIALEKENLSNLDKVMKELGYVERLPVNILELADQNKLDKYIKEKGLMAYTYLSGKGLRLALDIIVQESLNFDKFVANSNIVTAWDLDLPVISLDDLIGMKRTAGRDKDLLDLEALLQLKEYEED